MDVDVSLSAYLNTNTFDVIINAAGKKDTLKVQFSNDIPKYAVSSNDIFASTTIKDVNTLKVSETKNGVTIYPQLPLPKVLSMNEFMRVIGFIYGVPLDAIRLELHTENSRIGFINDMTVIGNTSSVGDGVYTIYLSHYPTNDDYHYSDEFLTNYIKILAYIKDICSSKLQKYHLNIFTNRIVFRTRINDTFKDKVSLPRLFNSLHVNDLWKKILIHDDILDDYYRNPFPTQYVKSDLDLKYPFKGTKTTFNTVTIYVNTPIHDGITLSKLDVNKYGDVSHTYTVMNTTLGYYYVQDEDITPISGAVSSTLYFTKFDEHSQQRTVIDALAERVVKSFDKSFLLKHNTVFKL